MVRVGPPCGGTRDGVRGGLVGRGCGARPSGIFLYRRIQCAEISIYVYIVVVHLPVLVRG